MNVELTEGLVAKIGGQLRKKVEKRSNMAARDSWYMKSLINNTTPLSFSGDVKDLTIPYGARLREGRGETLNYLFRTQLEYKKNIW
ncbi:hypothetical protein QIU19_09210 [Capnocytophaga canimorsus]|nr:hypothetical protein [Capnocytophaga canimorsus]WGU67682.1 hypothetical protein QIU19_09210 [Capnocytophaga canimorsus]